MVSGWLKGGEWVGGVAGCFKNFEVKKKVKKLRR